jgi:hypothetical protein
LETGYCEPGVLTGYCEPGVLTGYCQPEVENRIHKPKVIVGGFFLVKYLILLMYCVLFYYVLANRQF